MKKIFLFFTIVISSFLFGQSDKIMNQLINEVQQIKENDKSLKLVWWIPSDYWQIALEQQKQITPEQINYIKSLFDPYLVIAVGNYRLDLANREIVYESILSRESVLVTENDTNKLIPLKDSEIDPQTFTILNSFLKPLFQQMLGKTGEGLEILLYKNDSDQGKKIIDARKKGRFNVKVDLVDFHWNLPLVSLMEEKTCPVDQQKLQGNFVYCPFHGNKL